MDKLGTAKSMTPKHRVLAALAHQQPDRVPIDYSANPGIDRRLKAHFGLNPKDNEPLRQALGVDFRWVHVPYKGPRLHPEIPGRQVDPAWGRRKMWIAHDTGGYWDFCDFPLKDADLDAVANWPMPNPDHYDYSAIADSCRQNSQYAIICGGGPDVINSTGMWRTMEQTLIDLATDDPAGLLLIDRRCQILLHTLERTLEAGKGGIDIVWMGEDLGTQIGPTISPEMFRKHILPRHKPFADLAKSYNLPTIFHSCGSSGWAFDDLIDLGITCIDTLQPEAAHMSPAYLKQRFGSRLAFHGCISTAGPVAFGTPDEVTETCRRTLEIMMPGGGFCFAPTHQLQDNSPTENVVAMYEAAHRFGRYR